jgi:hypothetical protein
MSVSVDSTSFPTTPNGSAGRFIKSQTFSNPDYLVQKSPRAGNDGNKLSRMGFRGQTFTITAWYFDSNPFSTFAGDLSSWSNKLFTLQIDAGTFTNCQLVSADVLSHSGDAATGLEYILVSAHFEKVQ